MKTKRDRPLVMIADRDAVERAQLKAVLKLNGFGVIEAANGPEAIALAIGYRPDLLLLDLNLPKLRSPEAVWMIRREPSLRKMPIIAVSNNGHSRIPLDPLTVHATRPIEYTRLDILLTQFLRAPCFYSAMN